MIGVSPSGGSEPCQLLHVSERNVEGILWNGYYNIDLDKVLLMMRYSPVFT